MAMYSNTLAVIRQHLSSMVGDLIMGKADSGSVNTLIDTELANPGWGNDYFNEHKYRGYIFAGTGIGEERYVTDWTVSNTTLTFAPVFTNAISNTSQWELHNKFSADEYLKAINLGIEAMAGKYLIDIKDESTITLSADTYEYALPLSMLYLYRIITEDVVASDDYFNEDIIDPEYWSIIKSYAPKLKLDKRYYSIVAGKDLRLEGQGAQPKVDDDTDVIYLPPDWLIAEAILNLPRSKILSGKLDNVYRQAEKDAIYYRLTARNYPHPRARSVVE